MSQDTTYEELYRETVPSVVSIYTLAEDRGTIRGAGSGFVYCPDGEDASAENWYVVTNEHVVGDAEQVDLRFEEDDWRVGRVVGTDPYADLAVVRVPDVPSYAAPLPLVDVTPPPGTRVAALGNPMGLDGSITTGVVSGANRSMPTGRGFAIPDTVQTDAPINPGNSGGPLVTTDGAVVGVNRARAGDNIGFAVSAAVVERVVPPLIAEGEFRHPYLKVRTLDVSPSIAAANDLEEPGGLLVVDVALGPASGALVGCSGTDRVRGRIVPVGGDVITAVDGHDVDSHEALVRYLLLETDPGQEVAVELRRDGRPVTERIVLAERPRGGGRSRGHVPVR